MQSTIFVVDQKIFPAVRSVTVRPQ